MIKLKLKFDTNNKIILTKPKQVKDPLTQLSKLDFNSELLSQIFTFDNKSRNS